MADPNSSLQFDRAEFDGNAPGPASCAVCQQPLVGAYYEVGGSVACAGCKDRIEREWKQGTELGARLARGARATLYGVGAAVAGCALYYGVLAVTGWEVGLISILVGIMVGNAVRTGSRHRGGWLYQLLAMFLTYTSIVFSYVPIVLKEGQGTLAELEQQGPVAMAVMAVLAIPFMYVLPFVIVFQDASSILSLLIIGFGVYEAWRINKKVTLQISGPYSLSERPVAVPADAPPEPARP